ncbi:MAG: polysulfide reductase NrfD [Bacteroidales bacterium]|jgi:protein NrfD|nr:polysulfide reductase NrfD [Bacteroidales bacterium]
MREEIIVSGRMNPNIDPYLHIWHWQIPLYLFLGGLAAGILFFSAYYTVTGKEKKYKTAAYISTLIVPALLVFGLFCLFLDLKHKMYFWRLYTTIRLDSPMSWGAWILMLITPLSIILAAINVKKVFPDWKWKYPILEFLDQFFENYRKAIAWILVISAPILGIYTGILFSAFNARPLWNTSILGPLFLISGLSTAAAVNILFAKRHKEKLAYARIDLVLIGVELFLITHMFMGFMASTQVQIDSAKLFLGGPFTASFWVLVVMMGLVIPAILEILELKKFKIPAVVPAGLVLAGGLILRFIITNAGQMSRWLY